MLETVGRAQRGTRACIDSASGRVGGDGIEQAVRLRTNIVHRVSFMCSVRGGRQTQSAGCYKYYAQCDTQPALPQTTLYEKKI